MNFRRLSSKAAASSMNVVPIVFNRSAKIRQKDRSALAPDASRTTDYLKDEIADRLFDRFLV